MIILVGTNRIEETTGNIQDRDFILVNIRDSPEFTVMCLIANN